MLVAVIQLICFHFVSSKMRIISRGECGFSTRYWFIATHFYFRMVYHSSLEALKVYQHSLWYPIQSKNMKYKLYKKSVRFALFKSLVQTSNFKFCSEWQNDYGNCFELSTPTIRDKQSRKIMLIDYIREKKRTFLKIFQ